MLDGKSLKALLDCTFMDDPPAFVNVECRVIEPHNIAWIECEPDSLYFEDVVGRNLRRRVKPYAPVWATFHDALGAYFSLARALKSLHPHDAYDEVGANLLLRGEELVSSCVRYS